MHLSRPNAAYQNDNRFSVFPCIAVEFASQELQFDLCFTVQPLRESPGIQVLFWSLHMCIVLDVHGGQARTLQRICGLVC